MFKSDKKNTTSQAASTILAEGVIIESAIFKGIGTVRIDGKYTGEMQIDGNVIIGEKGIIHGNIKSSGIFVAGSVEGNITTDTEIHFTPSAKVTGNLSSQSIVIDEGASFNGNVSMTNKASAQSESPKQKDDFKSGSFILPKDDMESKNKENNGKPKELKELKELKDIRDLKDFA